MSVQKKPRVPRPRSQTDRKRLLDTLRDAPPQDAKQLSQAAGLSEKDVYTHLGHIEQSLKQEGLRLVIQPAECQSCEFVFTKRGRFSKPGRCPECRHERIYPPSYWLEEA